MVRGLLALLVVLGLLGPGTVLAQDTGGTPADTDPADDTDAEPWDSYPEADVYPTGARTVTCGHLPGGPAAAGLFLLVALAARRRRVRSPRAGLTLAALAAVAPLLALGPAAQAQDLTPGLDLQRFEPSGTASGFATVYTARQLEQKKVSAEILFTYAHRPLMRSRRVEDELIAQEDALSHLGAAHLRLAVGALDWLDVVVGMPVVQVVQARPGLEAFTDEQRGSPWAIGDPYLELVFTANPESKGAGVAIIPFVKAPAGTRRYFLTDGTVAFGARLALSGNVGPVHMAAHVGYMAKVGSDRISPWLAVDDEIPFGAGLGFQVIPQVLRLNLELAGSGVLWTLRGDIPAQPTVTALHTPLEANANLLVNIPSGFTFLLGGGAGLTAAPGTPNVRGFLGLGYVPMADPDRDGDGIPNAVDDCPDVPEDLDDFQDTDGCPDTDNDRDGLLDPDDGCPIDPEDLDGFEDDDGCPDLDNDGDGLPDTVDLCPDQPEDVDGWEDDDGCPDTDNDRDGIPDVTDACPDNPEDFDGKQDTDGCPEADLDQDGDGILDEIDVCPTVPEDLDGFQDLDGCPDPDNDGDGRPDLVDRCPMDPEDLDGFQDEDGCPDFDADGDGIPDQVDACPMEPEVINGVDDSDGCPDEAMARLTDERIEITETILFFTAEARIRPESFRVLDAVVSILVQYPQIERVRVEGHTDSQGSDTYNEDLSERRALAVRQYLIDAGISPARLLATGFGERFPVAPNGTAEGRAQNRRVEFVIVRDPAQLER
ncbi:MAG: OmpA family protein [Alphaproteobacteria bacterium]|nr:OmpA family protein [Alphaproteobacteria bacterium]